MSTYWDAGRGAQGAVPFPHHPPRSAYRVLRTAGERVVGRAEECR